MRPSSNFNLWLSQPVWVNSLVTIPRRAMIPVFAEELMQFLRKKGYVMSHEWRAGHMVVARWLYIIQKDELVRKHYDNKVAYPTPFHRNWPEDYDEFQYILDTETLRGFTDSWTHCEDFDPETRIGQRVINELQHLIYPYLDLDASRNGMRVASALADSDSDSDGGARRSKARMRGSGSGSKVDNYIADAQEGYHGGNWSKV